MGIKIKYVPLLNIKLRKIDTRTKYSPPTLYNPFYRFKLLINKYTFVVVLEMQRGRKGAGEQTSLGR